MRKFYVCFNDYRSGFAKKHFIDMIEAETENEALIKADEMARKEYESAPVETIDSIVDSFMEEAGYDDYDDLGPMDREYIEREYDETIFSYIEPIVEEVFDEDAVKLYGVEE